MNGPKEIELQREQLEKYLKWVEEEGGVELPTRLTTLFKPHQQFRFQWLKNNCVGTIMEFGTCWGYVLAYCNGQIGVDDNQNSIALARTLSPDRDFIIGDIKDLIFPNKLVDTVMIPDVLEHIAWEEVPMVLSEALRIATRRILVTVPYNEAKLEAGCFKHQWLCTPTKLVEMMRFFRSRKTTVEKKNGFALIRVIL